MRIIKKDEFVKLKNVKDYIDNLGFNELWDKKGEGIYCINYGSRYDVELYYVDNLGNELNCIFDSIRYNLESYYEEGDEYLIKFVKESLDGELGLFEFLSFIEEEENEEGKLYMDLVVYEEDSRSYFIIKE